MRILSITSALLLSVIMLMTNCTSGKKAYEQGDYYAAVTKAVNRLKSKPSHKKSKETLRKSYPLAVESQERRANTAFQQNDPNKFKIKLKAYESINALYNLIKSTPGARAVISNPKSYFNEVAQLKEQAAEESYNIGEDLLAQDTRESAKQAYFNFRDANNFVPGYKDLINKMNEAKFLATLKVLVEQIPVPTMYRLSADFFQDKVEEFLHTQYRSNEFVRFYTPQEAEAENLPFVDQYLRLQFDDFVVGETHLESHTETVKRDSVVVGKTKLRDGSEVNVYNTVSAKITLFRKEVKSRGLFSMRAVDANNNAVLTHRKFSGEFIWFSEWGNFNGDERALTEEEIAICNSREVPPPPPQDLFIEFTKPIYNQLVSGINSFYRNY